MHNHALPYWCASQDRWIQDSRAAAKLVATCGDKALGLIRDMERVGHITAATFRAVEPITTPEDLHRLVDLMDVAHGKPTSSRLRQVSAEIAESRWWRWCLLHPDIPEDVIDKSRRMLPFTCAVCWGWLVGRRMRLPQSRRTWDEWDVHMDTPFPQVREVLSNALWRGA